MTPYPNFKVRPFFDAEYRRNGYRYGHSYYGKRIGNCTQAIFVPPAAIYSLFHGFSSIRPSHLHCRWTNDMELVPKQFTWAGHANWLFSSCTVDVSFWSVLGTLSALEALFATMRYINWHRHLHLHFKWHNFQWPWVTSNPHFKVTIIFVVK